MRVAVTGATGFVGRHLTRALVGAGHRVTVFRRAGSNRHVLDGLGVDERVWDLAAPPPYPRCLEGFEWVFHVAADLSWWRTDRRRQWAVNVEGTRRVVQEALRSRIGRLIYTSSVAAIGFPMNGQVADERFTFNGRQLGIQYGLSKWEGEQRVLEGVRQGLDAVIVNPSTILGDERPRPGTLVDRIRRGAMPAWVAGGTNFCFIDDVVAGHLAAAERGRTGTRYILGGHNVTFRQALQDLAEAAGRVAPRWEVPAAGVWMVAGIGELAAWVLRRPPPLTRDHARLAGRLLYYDSSEAMRALGYRVTAWPQVVRETMRRAGRPV